MITRRQFFSLAGVALAGGASHVGLETLKARAPVLLRPPGALDEPAFLAACLRCGQCVQACPYHTLSLADVTNGVAFGTPYLVARLVPCRLCQGHATLKCIATCPSSALQAVASWRAVRMGTAHINHDTCLAWQGAVCRACWHVCPFPNEAIVFDEYARVSVHAEHCIGCGLCDHACPTEPSSITIQPRGVA